MRQPKSTPEQLQLAALSVATRTALNAADLSRLAYYADGDESLMEEALLRGCEGGPCSVTAAEHILCLRLLTED